MRWRARRRLMGIENPSRPSRLGARSEQMTFQHYDKLMNQGFRRWERFLYKPDLLRGCCR